MEFLACINSKFAEKNTSRCYIAKECCIIMFCSGSSLAGQEVEDTTASPSIAQLERKIQTLGLGLHDGQEKTKMIKQRGIRDDHP